MEQLLRDNVETLTVSGVPNPNGYLNGLTQTDIYNIIGHPQLDHSLEDANQTSAKFSKKFKLTSNGMKNNQIYRCYHCSVSTFSLRLLKYHITDSHFKPLESSRYSKSTRQISKNKMKNYCKGIEFSPRHSSTLKLKQNNKLLITNEKGKQNNSQIRKPSSKSVIGGRKVDEVQKLGHETQTFPVNKCDQTCLHCEYRYSLVSNMKRHTICSNCKFQSPLLNQTRDHVINYSNVRCPNCDSRKFYVIIKRDESNQFLCPSCDSRSTSEDFIRDHFLINHGEELRRCTLCGFTNTSKQFGNNTVAHQVSDQIEHKTEQTYLDNIPDNETSHYSERDSLDDTGKQIKKRTLVEKTSPEMLNLAVEPIKDQSSDVANKPTKKAIMDKLINNNILSLTDEITKQMLILTPKPNVNKPQKFAVTSKLIKISNSETEIKLSNTKTEIKLSNTKTEIKVSNTKTEKTSALSAKVIKKPKPEKPIRCIQCKYKAPNLEELKAHVDEHLAEVQRLLFCPECLFNCVSQLQLEEHIKKTHIRCEQCEFKCERESIMRSHVKRTHNKSKVCPHCGFRCLDQESMDVHVASKHKDVLLKKCHYCDYKGTHTKLITHLRGHHHIDTFNSFVSKKLNLIKTEESLEPLCHRCKGQIAPSETASVSFTPLNVLTNYGGIKPGKSCSKDWHTPVEESPISTGSVSCQRYRTPAKQP